MLQRREWKLGDAVVTSSEHLKHRLDYEVGKGLTNLEHIGRSVATREVAFREVSVLCIIVHLQLHASFPSCSPRLLSGPISSLFSGDNFRSRMVSFLSLAAPLSPYFSLLSLLLPYCRWAVALSSGLSSCLTLLLGGSQL